MRRNFFNMITSYTNKINIHYQAIKKINTSTPVLKLISPEINKKTKKVKFKIQVSGKNIFPVLSLEDLQNSKIFSNFNKNDQEIICNYYSSNQFLPKKRIAARTYDKEKKNFVYTIEFTDSKHNKRKCVTIDTLSLLLADINSFDADDACLIRLEANKDLH